LARLSQERFFITLPVLILMVLRLVRERLEHAQMIRR
jgi:hypothetical protein